MLWQEQDMPSELTVGAVCVCTNKAKELDKNRVEGTLARQLGFIIILDILFWLPLLILALSEFVDCAKSCETITTLGLSKWEINAKFNV